VFTVVLLLLGLLLLGLDGGKLYEKLGLVGDDNTPNGSGSAGGAGVVISHFYLQKGPPTSPPQK
jgi:hypothetical protein